MTFADHILEFNQSLNFTGKLPKGVGIMNPFRDNPGINAITEQFYHKYYNDSKTRHLILGINPGRFGAGVTGVPFTDTKRMREKCGIDIPGFETHETSSVFVYDVIDSYGGAEKFYSDYYINSVCPLGFTSIGKNGKEVNYNYYDSKELTNAVYSFIVECIKKQLMFPIKRDVCFCLGAGKNYEFLSMLNERHQFFGRIVPLDHPRFVMQYRLKRKQEYISKYIKEFNNL